MSDITYIWTWEGWLYLATVIDLYSRRLLAAATSLRCDAELCEQAIKIAAAVRGGKTKIDNVVFHTDRGSTLGFNGSSQHRGFQRYGSRFDALVKPVLDLLACF